MRDKMHKHFNPACPRPALILTHLSVPRSFSAARFQPLVDDVIEQLVPTIEQHYWSLITRFVGAASFVELRDGAIHGGPTLTRGVDGFSGRVNISCTHACTIKNSSSDIVFNSSLGHWSGPWRLTWFWKVFNVLCDLLTGECTMQLALRANSGSVCVDFELGHPVQRCYCCFVVPEICEVPAPLAEGNYLSSVVLGCVLRDTCTGFARIAPIGHRRLRPPSSC